MPQATRTPITSTPAGSSGRRTLLTGAGTLSLGALIGLPQTHAAQNPDAALIRTCAEHIHNLTTYNTIGGKLGCDDDPLWRAYERTLDAIHEAVPRTMAGLLAKARAAQAEAEATGYDDDAEEWHNGPAAYFAVQLAEDLLRLHSEGVL